MYENLDLSNLHKLQNLNLTNIKHATNLNIHLHDDVKNTAVTTIIERSGNYEISQLLLDLFKSDCKNFIIEIDDVRLGLSKTTT